MTSAEERVRRMLSVKLRVEESALKRDFRWLDFMGIEDAEWFLAELDETFTKIPPGPSLGDGERLFRYLGADLMKQIATVGGLIDVVTAHQEH